MHVGNYWWWGIWASPDSNLEFYADPCLTLAVEGETLVFEISEHVERLFGQLAVITVGGTEVLMRQGGVIS